MARKQFLGRRLPSYYVVCGDPVEVSETPDGGVLFRYYNPDAGEWEPAGHYIGKIVDGDEDAVLTRTQCGRYRAALDELRAGRFMGRDLPFFSIWSGTPVKITRTTETKASRFIVTGGKWQDALPKDYLYEMYNGATPEILHRDEFDRYVAELEKLRSNTFLGRKLPLFCLVDGDPAKIARNEYGLLRAELCAGRKLAEGGRFLNTDDLLRRLFLADRKTPLMTEAEFRQRLPVRRR